jgi:transcriptional regulator with XRE-family HTH domain
VELGRSLRAARNQPRATQAQIPKKAGMTQAELSRLENGLLAKGVTYTTLAQLSYALGRQGSCRWPRALRPSRRCRTLRPRVTLAMRESP